MIWPSANPALSVRHNDDGLSWRFMMIYYCDDDGDDVATMMIMMMPG